MPSLEFFALGDQVQIRVTHFRDYHLLPAGVPLELYIAQSMFQKVNNINHCLHL